MTQLAPEIRRRWSSHQDRLLESAIRHRDACARDAWLTPTQLFTKALQALQGQSDQIRKRVGEAFSSPTLSEREREMLKAHLAQLESILERAPTEESLGLVRRAQGDAIGEVLRKAPKPSEKGPGEVLQRVDWTLRVVFTEELEFQLGGKVEKPLPNKDASSLALPLDEGYEERIATYRSWRTAPFHDPLAVRKEETQSTWRFLILPPSTTAPQMLERLGELQRAMQASTIGRAVDRCGVVTDDLRQARIAHEKGFLAFVPPLP